MGVWKRAGFSAPQLSSKVESPLNVCRRSLSEQVATPFLARPTRVHPSVFVARSAELLGDIEIGEDSSVFYGCVLRADINQIRVGTGTNIQDGTVIHLSRAYPSVIGNNVTVGHKAIIHACTIGNNVLIGMGAIIMDGAVIGDNSIVAAGAVVTMGKTFPANSLIVGSPAKRMRDLTLEEVDFVADSARRYVHVAREHNAFQAKKRGNS